MNPATSPNALVTGQEEETKKPDQASLPGTFRAIGDGNRDHEKLSHVSGITCRGHHPVRGAFPDRPETGSGSWKGGFVLNSKVVSEHQAGLSLPNQKPASA